MKNSTKVRLHLSKELFESLTKEIIKEAKANDGYTVAVKQPKQPKQSKAQATSPEVQKTDKEAKMEAAQGQQTTASTSTLAKNFRAKAQELPKMQGISSREAQSLQKLLDTILAKAPGGELAMAIDKAQRALDTASQNIKTADTKQQTHSPGSNYTQGSFMGQRGEEKPSKFTSGVAKPAANQRFEEMEMNVAEEGQLNEMDPSAVDIGAVLSGMAAIGVTPVLVDKFWQYIKKKNPEAYKKAQALSSAMDQKVGGNAPGQGHGVDTSKTFGPQEEALKEFTGTETESSGAIAMLAAALGMGVPLAAALIKDLMKKKTPEEKKQAVDAALTKKTRTGTTSLEEYEHHYEMVNGQCRRYNDEGDYEVVSSHYCR